MTTEIPLETFILLDERLAKRLLPAWRKHALPLATRIGKAVEDNNDNLAQELIEQLDLTVVLERGNKDVKLFGMMGLLFGASQLSDARATVFKGQKSPPILVEAVKQFAATIEELNKAIRATLRGSIQQWRTQQAEATAPQYKEDSGRVVKADPIRKFTSFAKTQTGKAGLSSLQLASSLHMSRLSAWGYTEEAQFLGATHYKINEQLDGRTCPVCREMHGKIFAVKDARKKLDTVLYAEPDALKTINPWPSQSRNNVAGLKVMTEAEFVANGWETPPYHPYCRGLLTKLGKKDKVPALAEAAIRPAPSQRGPVIQTATDREVVEAVQDDLLGAYRTALTNEDKVLADEVVFAMDNILEDGARGVQARADALRLTNRDMNGNRKWEDQREQNGVTPEQISAEMNREHRQHYQSNLNGNRNAVNTYTGSSFIEINEALRESAGDLSKIAITERADLIRDIDEGINVGAMAYPTTLWRGTKLKMTPEQMLGAKYKDYAYQSSSVRKTTAESFGGTSKQANEVQSYLFRIRAEAGQKGAYVAEISDFENEMEFLLPRGTTIVNDKVTWVPSPHYPNEGYYLVDAHIEAI